MSQDNLLGKYFENKKDLPNLSCRFIEAIACKAGY
jgi:hypothetical protein